MSDEALTAPTLETLSKQIEDLRAEMRDGFVVAGEELHVIKNRLDIVESRSVQMDARNGCREAIFYQIRAEALGLRADFKEFRSRFKAPA
jgi:hypothetical protein